MGTTTDKRTDDEPIKEATHKNGETEDGAAGPPAEGAGADEAKAGTTAGRTATAAESGTGTDKAADTDTAAENDNDKADAEHEADAPEEEPEPTRSGAAAGAGAVVAAGLGLASVTGTWLGTLLAERQTLLGQIKLQSGKATDQIATLYGAPWHTTALVNGVFAVLAMLVAAVVLTGRRSTWARAVAWGGLALGLLGLLVSAGMYLDLFASLPSLPKAPGGGA
ncbi:MULTISPECIES: hypothetical protein [unclassified Streptomyces]|uniref:hypothetical protein n=1 Tax=unclassified Streptomyces TaxID=2593676 RepID=UPI000379D7E2|nr:MULTISPECIES: hypothetical protein [unclassified Streptomyces]MYT28431.1 hypothetical protein [Streptomyces sp. SID8354]